MGHGAGPLKGGSRSHTMHLWDSCMFHRCVFFHILGTIHLKLVPIRGIINENAIIRRISLIGIVGNVALSAFKLFAGIVGRSGAMVSDAVHSLSDVFATFIAFLGVRLSKKAADQKHPYGHERFECVASLLLGVILLITGLGIGRAGLEKILAGSYETLADPSAIAQDDADV